MAPMGEWTQSLDVFVQKLQSVQAPGRPVPAQRAVQELPPHVKVGQTCYVRGVLLPQGYKRWVRGTYLKAETKTYFDGVETTAVRVKYAVNDEEREDYFHPRWAEIYIPPLQRFAPIWDDIFFQDLVKARLVFTPTQDTAEGALAGPAPAGPDGWRPAFHVGNVQENGRTLQIVCTVPTAAARREKVHVVAPYFAQSGLGDVSEATPPTITVAAL